jgi:ATP-dependent DNA helicase Rep
MKNMQELLNKLNPQQIAAVKYTDGPLLVLAGAGSGKTRVITHKIAYLISCCAIPAKQITALTFTNKAAQEMQERVSTMTHGLNLRGLNLCTFHALGLKILRSEAAAIGYKSNFSLLDSYDCGKIISDILNTTNKGLSSETQSQISLWKNAFISPEQLLHSADNEVQRMQAQIYRKYQDLLRTYHACDFDDLIKVSVELLSNNLSILYKWQLKTRYLLIDEYQDTNISQYQLIKLLSGSTGNFTAVGDDDQSIYAWRGANSENLKLLTDDYTKLKIIKLTQNYRSTQTILHAANQVIQNNPKLFEKKLWSDYGTGEAIRIISCASEEVEAETIARKIMLHQLHKNSKFSDYAILYRGNHQARVMEQALRNYKLPYTVVGGQSFFEKPEIKDIMAYLRVLNNHNDDNAFIRAITTPKRGVGQATLDKLVNYATGCNQSLFNALNTEGFASLLSGAALENIQLFAKFLNHLKQRQSVVSVGELLAELVEGIAYEKYLYEQEDGKAGEKRWANVQNLVQWLTNKSVQEQQSVADLVQWVTLITLLEGRENETPNAIKLSTIHAAKGLEYPYVFIISCEEGILPHAEALTQGFLDEERRLMYVAITRARYELTLSYCEKRRKAGALELCQRSRFITEMGEQNIVDEALHKHTKITSKEELSSKLNSLRALLYQ